MTNKAEPFAELFTDANKKLTELLSSHRSTYRYILTQLEALNTTATAYNQLRTLIPPHLLPSDAVGYDRLAHWEVVETGEVD